MKCTRVEFTGYKRLVKAQCNLDDRLIAFVGPNEAGKSSVLQGLAWLEGGSPLPPGAASRGQPVGDRSDEDTIACANYRLDTDDWIAIQDLDFQREDDTYVYRRWKVRDGSPYHALRPRLRRNPEPFDRARRALAKAPKALEGALRATDERSREDGDEISPERTWSQTCRAFVEKPDSAATESDIESMTSYASWLRDIGTGNAKPSLVAAGEAVAELAVVLGREHPHDAALSVLDERRPRFREFDRADRLLENEHAVTDEGQVPSVAFRRILDLGGTKLQYLRDVWADEGQRDTHLADCNRRLNDFFSTAWTQSRLSIHLKAEQHLLKLQVTVTEGDTTYYSTFGERSEGLKAFVALVGFLHSLPEDSPPILLIDEAETHLHLDAQADLIQVLQDRVRVTQVFYSTHSPGCLPLDLGRGLRFVEPTVHHYSSTLSHNFWDSKYPGFSSVLFKMGASAFAFSALRKAVLAEGSTDMILLPRLLRDATDLETLPYQVAPRMSDFDESEVERSEIATNVVYLVDGDQGGRDRRKNLLRKYKVPRELILSHASGYAVEDYIDAATVVRVVSALRADDKQEAQLTISALPTGHTLSQRIEKWFSLRHIDPPSKFAVATRLANSQDLKLRPGAKQKLQTLHNEIVAALIQRPSGS